MRKFLFFFITIILLNNKVLSLDLPITQGSIISRIYNGKNILFTFLNSSGLGGISVTESSESH